MSTKKPTKTKSTSAPKSAAAPAKAKDLKPKKDPKGGPLGGFSLNHNTALLHLIS